AAAPVLAARALAAQSLAGRSATGPLLPCPWHAAQAGRHQSASRSGPSDRWLRPRGRHPRDLGFPRRSRPGPARHSSARTLCRPRARQPPTPRTPPRLRLGGTTPRKPPLLRLGGTTPRNPPLLRLGGTRCHLGTPQTPMARNPARDAACPADAESSCVSRALT